MTACNIFNVGNNLVVYHIKLTIISATFATVYVMLIIQLLKFKQLIHVTCVCDF